MTRPETPIDWKKVETMMKAGCSGAEIAGEMGIHPETFYVRFKDKYKEGFTGISHSKKIAGHGNLRTRQYISAMQGNTAMLNRLGEEWLGQGKKSDITESNDRAYIQLVQHVQKIEAILRSLGVSLEGIQVEQPVPHQRPEWEQDQVPDELGTTNPMEREA